MQILVLVRMVLLLLVQLVLPMVPVFARLVPVDITKMAIVVLGVNLLVVREQDKQRLVRLCPIVYVHRIRASVPTVLKQPVPLVLPMVPVFARPVSVDITKMAIVVLVLKARVRK